jgi:hypothetical protein
VLSMVALQAPRKSDSPFISLTGKARIDEIEGRVGDTEIHLRK